LPAKYQRNHVVIADKAAPTTKNSQPLSRIRDRIPGAVASSDATAQRLRALGVQVLDLNDVESLPVYVDGADEITRDLAMIKGGGGALTREKIVGVVTNGLFARRGADMLLLGTVAGVRTIQRA